MRSRSRYKQDSRTRTYQRNMATGIDIQSFITSINSVHETMVDTVTPGYTNRVAQAILPQNQLSYTCLSNTEPYTTTVVKDGGGVRTWNIVGNTTQFHTKSWYAGTFPSIPAMPANAPTLVHLTSVAQAKALARIDKPDHAFGEPIAEIANTLRTIRDPIKTIFKISRSFKRNLKLRRIKHGSREFSDFWLSYSVNLGPNIGAVSDIISATASRFARFPPVKSDYAEETYDSGPLFADTAGVIGGWNHRRKCRRVVRYKAKAGLIYSVNDRNSKSTWLGLRARDLPVVGWELIPFSFMIDRMYNVSGFLQACGALLSSNVEILGGYTVVRTEDSRTYRFTDLSTGGAGNSWTPRDTTPWESTSFSISRSSWKPTFANALPPLNVGGLVRDLHSTLDLVTLSIKNLLR